VKLLTQLDVRKAKEAGFWKTQARADALCRQLGLRGGKATSRRLVQKLERDEHAENNATKFCFVYTSGLSLSLIFDEFRGVSPVSFNTTRR
jgi:hypothetical protein